jgi:hypothetical protein
MSRLDELKREVAELEAKAGQQSAQQQTEQQSAAPWATIPDDDPALVPLMEKVESADYLAFWPEHKNRSLDEAKEIVFLRRIIGDSAKSHRERWEAESAILAIRRKLQGDNG